MSSHHVAVSFAPIEFDGSLMLALVREAQEMLGGRSWRNRDRTPRALRRARRELESKLLLQRGKQRLLSERQSVSA